MLKSVVGAGGIAAVTTVAGTQSASAAAAGNEPLPAGWFDVTNSLYGATGNGTTDDGPAINRAIAAALGVSGAVGGGVVYFPPGTYLVEESLTAPVANQGLRLTGAHFFSSQIVTTSTSILSLQQGHKITGMEVDHLTLEATNTHIITGADVKAFHLHDCQLIQNSPDYGIWNAPAAALMLECVFERNLENVYGATRTVPAWVLSTPSSSGAINSNLWRDSVCQNWDNDATQYWYQVVATGVDDTTNGPLPATNEANTFDNLTFEYPFGGMIDIQSATRTRIQQCIAWDAAGTIGTIEQSFINIRSSATGGPSADTLIIGAIRASTDEVLGTGVYDIEVAANAVHTTVIAPSFDTQINFNGSSGAQVIGAPPGPAPQAAAGSGAGASAPAPVVTPASDNRSGLITFGTGTSPEAGWQVAVTFGSPFATLPSVMITPANGPTAGLLCAVESVTVNGFAFSTGNAPSASQPASHYAFYWQATS